MSGDNNKKEEMKHREDEKSQAISAKQDDKKSIEKEDKSEEHKILEDMPPEMRKGVEAIFSMGSFSRSGLSPFESKINEKHIDKILNIKEKYDDYSFRDTQSSRKFHLIYTVIGISLFVFLTLFLVGKHSNLLEDIIKFIIGIVGGIGIGYGFKSYKDRD